MGVVVEDFSESFSASLFHGLNAAEGIFNQLGIVFVRGQLGGFRYKWGVWRANVELVFGHAGFGV